MKVIKVQSLEKESFAPFGKLVSVPDSEPTKIGQGWKCWNYVEMMNVDTEIGMGLVKTERRPFTVDSMERHDSREELLIAIEKDIIQPVASFEQLFDANEVPKIENVRCFYLKKGQGIILNKGIWHSPAYAAEESTTYFFAIENKPDKHGDEIINPWVTFEEGKQVQFVK